MNEETGPVASFFWMIVALIGVAICLGAAAFVAGAGSQLLIQAFDFGWEWAQ